MFHQLKTIEFCKVMSHILMSDDVWVLEELKHLGFDAYSYRTRWASQAFLDCATALEQGVSINTLAFDMFLNRVSVDVTQEGMFRWLQEDDHASKYTGEIDTESKDYDMYLLQQAQLREIRDCYEKVFAFLREETELISFLPTPDMESAFLSALRERANGRHSRSGFWKGKKKDSS